MSQQEQGTTEQKQRSDTTQTGAGDKVFTAWQATTLIPSTVFSVAVLTLPRNVASATGSDGFFAVLGAGLVSLFIVWLVTLLGQKFPGMTFIRYTQHILSFRSSEKIARWLSFPFIFSTVLWWIAITALTLRLFGEVQRSAVFQETPLWFMVGTMLFTCALVAYNRAEVIARINEFLFPLILVPLLFIGALSFQSAEWLNLLPLFHFSWGQFFKGMLAAAGVYQGVSVLLIFMASYQQPGKAVRSHFVGVGFAMVVYLLITVSAMAVFGQDSLKQLMWPTLDLVKSTQFPGLIFERMESAFLAVWVAAVFTTVANFMTCTVEAVSEYGGMPLAKRAWVVLPLTILIFVLAMLPQGLPEAFRWGRRLTMYGIILSFAYPLLLYPIMWIKGVGRRDSQAGNGAAEPESGQKS